MSDAPTRPPAAAEPPRARRLGALWGAFFAYGLAAGFGVQLILLPHVFPAWHAGNGLLALPGNDSVHFHGAAASGARRIQREGWSAFDLRLDRHTPAGIASAIYALTWPEPWTLVPLNAAVHATAGLLLFRLVRRFVPDGRFALAGTLPFLLYPSTLMWVAQIHKDGLYILAILAILSGWVALAGPGGAESPGWRAILGAAGLVLGGFGLLWVARLEQVRVFQGVGILVLVAIAASWLVRATRTPALWPKAAAVPVLAVLATVLSAGLPDSAPRIKPAEAIGVIEVSPRTSLAPRPGRRPPLYDANQAPQTGVGAIHWYHQPGLPASAERYAYSLALIREQYLVGYRDASSNVDIGVSLHSAGDILRYVPRALQVALWAPFPTQWRAIGSSPAATALRRVTAAEMLGVYAGMLPLPLVIWRRRRRLDLWIVLAVCLALPLIQALAIPNLGALYRFRYGFLMTLVALGVAGGLELLAERSRRGSGPR